MYFQHVKTLLLIQISVSFVRNTGILTLLSSNCLVVLRDLRSFPVSSMCMFRVCHQQNLHLARRRSNTTNWGIFFRRIRLLHLMLSNLNVTYRSSTRTFSRSEERFVCLFITEIFSKCILSMIVDNMPTLCCPLTCSAFKKGISVPLGKAVHPKNGLRSYVSSTMMCAEQLTMPSRLTAGFSMLSLFFKLTRPSVWTPRRRRSWYVWHVSWNFYHKNSFPWKIIVLLLNRTSSVVMNS